jgi:hypothetical protein
MKILLTVIYLCSCLAFADSIFRIEPGGIVPGKMELDICGEMDGDQGFNETVPVKRKTWSKEDIVIPQTDLKCGEYLFIREKRKNSRWLLIDKEGNILGYAEMYLFETERKARKFLKNGLLSPNRMTLKDVWGKEGTCCIFKDMKEYPKTLLYATRGNLGLSIRGPRERDIWNLKLAECVLNFFLDRSTWGPADEKEVAAALTRRKAMLADLKLRKEAEYKKEQEAKELEKWKKEPCYQMPPLCGEVMAYNSSQAPVELLKHGESLSGELVIPNAHEGRITLDLLKKWGGQLFRVEGVGHLRNGVYTELEPCGKLEETMEHGARVEILVAHARSRKEAMELLLKLRFYDPRNTQRAPKDVAASTVIKPGKVGDFDLGCGPVLGPDGALMKGSEQSAVYFLRGNTAVMVLSTDPGYPVLGMARKLDAALQGKEVRSMSQSD